MAGDPRHTPAAPDPQAASIDTQLTPSGTAFAAVAHEINNPITYVLGNLAELERLTAAMREVIVSYRNVSSQTHGEYDREAVHGNAERLVDHTRVGEHHLERRGERRSV